MGKSTVTLATVINFARTHIDLLPLVDVGGYSNEPALSLCNDALSELLTTPNDWKFNRAELPILVTAANKQDYLFAGASAFTLGSNVSNGVGIGLATKSAIVQSGTTVTVNTLEPHRFKVGQTVFMAGNTVAGYNSTFSDDGHASGWSGGWPITVVPTPTSFQFELVTSLGISGAPGISDYGWLSSASMVEMNNTSSPAHTLQLTAVRELPVLSRVANPEKVSVMTDNYDGTLKIRFSYVPGSTIWGANLVYQAKAPMKTSLADKWDPFPDSYSAVFRQAFLYRAYRYLNSARTEVEYGKMQQEVMRAQGADDNEPSDVHVVPEESLLDDSFYGGW